MRKVRIDYLLLEKGLVESRNKAQALVMAGQVRVNDQMIIKPSQKIPENSDIVIEKKADFVSRGGYKLEAAMNAFGVDVKDKVCADVGSSTGGFTDCLLKHGALKVYALDVGYGLMHWELRQDARVIVMERTNVRYMEELPETISFAAIDVSFISLSYILPSVSRWFEGNPGWVVSLIKPQFEAGRKEASYHRGVIKSQEVHKDVLVKVLTEARKIGYNIDGLILSPIKGTKGNIEFLVDLSINQNKPVLDIQSLVDGVIPQLIEQ